MSKHGNYGNLIVLL